MHYTDGNPKGWGYLVGESSTKLAGRFREIQVGEKSNSPRCNRFVFFAFQPAPTQVVA